MPESRSSDTAFLGRAVLSLPPRHILEPVIVSLSREETLIYRYVGISAYVSSAITLTHLENGQPDVDN